MGGDVKERNVYDTARHLALIFTTFFENAFLLRIDFTNWKIQILAPIDIIFWNSKEGNPEVGNAPTTHHEKRFFFFFFLKKWKERKWGLADQANPKEAGVAKTEKKEMGFLIPFFSFAHFHIFSKMTRGFMFDIRLWFPSFSTETSKRAHLYIELLPNFFLSPLSITLPD